MGRVLLVLFDDAVAAHEGEDAVFVLVEACGLALGEEGAEVLGFEGQELVGFCVEVGLKFFDLGEVGFVVVDVDFGHDFAVVVAELGVDLDWKRCT